MSDPGLSEGQSCYFLTCLFPPDEEEEENTEDQDERGNLRGLIDDGDEEEADDDESQKSAASGGGSDSEEEVRHRPKKRSKFISLYKRHIHHLGSDLDIVRLVMALTCVPSACSPYVLVCFV